MDSLTDIRMNDYWKLTQAASGDAPTISGKECILQDIRLEAVTHEGELFYDEEYGWSLQDFIQSDDTDLNRIEIGQRIRTKLSNRDYIDTDSIETSIRFSDDIITISVSFKFKSNDEMYTVDAVIDRIRVEVTNED